MWVANTQTSWVVVINGSAASRPKRCGATSSAGRAHAAPPKTMQGIEELEELATFLGDSNVPRANYQFDFSMVRGLAYYTGPIYETVITEPKIGSLTGGGRYDGLIEELGGPPTPGVGFAIGLVLGIGMAGMNGWELAERVRRHEEAKIDRLRFGADGKLSEEGAAFIASCAGPAEAGWRATIAAVDAVLMLNSVDLSPCDGGSCMVATSAEESLDMIRGCAASAIIAAWPEEVLA